MQLNRQLLIAVVTLLMVTVASNAVSLRYRLAKPAQVSLNVYDAQGHLVRELLHAAARSAGPHSEEWDGLDSDGASLPATQYTWKLLATNGLHAQYLLTLGTNPSPAWDTWPGNHGGIYALCSDGTDMYVGTSCGEGTVMIVKQTFDGKRVWSVPGWYEGFTGPIALSKVANMLFMAQPNAHVFRIDDATGKQLSAWDLSWGGVEADDVPLAFSSFNVDMAAHGDQLVVAYRHHDAIRWFDQTTGKQIDQAAVPAPLGVAIDDSGRVLIVSKDTVVTLTRDDKTPKVLITGLDGGYRIAIDPATQDIFVAEQGLGQQVKRYGKDGAFIRAYGVKGGRVRDGLYDPTSFADITSIAADGHGGFLASESSAPRRTGWFSADGKLLHDWIGPQMYASYACADPADPTLVWGESQFGSLNEYKVNYTTGTWTVVATYTYAGLADGLVGTHNHGTDSWYVRHHGDHTYLCRDGHPMVLEVDNVHHRLIPRAIFNLGWFPQGGALKIVEEIDKKFGKTTAQGCSVLWTDKNGDGKVELDEVELANLDPWGGERGQYVGPDMTYVRAMYAPYDPTVITVIPIKQWINGEIPYYDYGAGLKHLGARPAGTNAGAGGALVGSDGSFYTIASTTANDPGGWNRIIKWDRAGNLTFVLGRNAASSQAGPGEIKMLYRPVAYTHDCIVYGEYPDSLIDVWDKDGLWVGRLLENPDLKAAPASAYVLCGENFGNSLYTNPGTGNVLLFGGGQNNTPVFKITGWDQFTRQSGKVALLTATHAVAQNNGASFVSLNTEVHITHLASFTPDGSLDKWQHIAPLTILDGNTVRARVYLGWTADGLCAAFDVNTDRPWKSSHTTPQLAFQGGAAVDISMGPIGARTTPIPGDVRYVAAPNQGGAQVSELMPQLSLDLTAADAVPATYRTGQGQTVFSRSALAKSAPCAVFVKPGGAGYVVEFRVPLHAPLTAAAGQELRLDASVILSNALGTSSATRLSWHSRDPNDAVTQDTYLESLLRPQNWGVAVLDP